MSRSRQGTPFSRYSDSPLRYRRRVTLVFSEPFKAGSPLLSIIRLTSAKLPEFLELLPVKMTDSIRSPRRDLALCSPKTQRMESTRLLLPQPLGPTMEVMPELKFKAVLLGKDLNPINSSSAKR